MILAAALLLCCPALAESAPDQPVNQHTESHQTMEWLHGAAEITQSGSLETHLVVFTYDLYCVDCQKVVEENFKISEVTENHEWAVERTEPTCAAPGREHSVCVKCGVEYTEILPVLPHAWTEWETIASDEGAPCEGETLQARRCPNCLEEEIRTLPATGHVWETVESVEPTCEEPGMALRRCAQCQKEEREEFPALGHAFASPTVLSGQPAGPVFAEGGALAGEVYVPNTCLEPGSAALICLHCQQEREELLLPPMGHDWSPWEAEEIPPELVCVSDVKGTRRCQRCGLEEETVLEKAKGHQWEAIRYSNPTCTEEGEAVRRCTVCGLENMIFTPALGHCYAWVDVNDPQSGVVSQYVCSLCGDVKETRKAVVSRMFYNNTITSFGPTTRELIGGSVWNRVTPIDLSQEGTFTYPLVASNMFTVGTATLINDQSGQRVLYRLYSPQITVHSQSLVVYPNLEALRTGENSVSLEFDAPLDLREFFREDDRLILAITLRADYDANGFGVQYFSPDQELIDEMMNLLD